MGGLPIAQVLGPDQGALSATFMGVCSACKSGLSLASALAQAGKVSAWCSACPTMQPSPHNLFFTQAVPEAWQEWLHQNYEEPDGCGTPP